MIWVSDITIRRSYATFSFYLKSLSEPRVHRFNMCRAAVLFKRRPGVSNCAGLVLHSYLDGTTHLCKATLLCTVISSYITPAMSRCATL